MSSSNDSSLRDKSAEVLVNSLERDLKPVNVERLFIITMNTDAMVRQSAMGFLYKYMMRKGTNHITVAHLDTSTWELETLTEATRQGNDVRWTVQTKSKWVDSRDGEVKAEVAADHQGKLNELMDSAAAADGPNYRRVTENGAIVVSHGTTTTIDGVEPEIIAKAFITLSKSGKLPVFDKIVFNACRIGKTLFEKNHLVNQGVIYWEHESVKKVPKKGPSPAVPATHKFNFLPDAEVTQEDLLRSEITESMGSFNCVYRFLNVYGKGCGKDKVMVAGYDAPVTAAHPDKRDLPVEGQGAHGSAQEIANSGRKYLLEGPNPQEWMKKKHKVAYVFTKSANNITTAEVTQLGWSDAGWSDK